VKAVLKEIFIAVNNDMKTEGSPQVNNIYLKKLEKNTKLSKNKQKKKKLIKIRKEINKNREWKTIYSPKPKISSLKGLTK
jgi:hypothetical protein